MFVYNPWRRWCTSISCWYYNFDCTFNEKWTIPEIRSQFGEFLGLDFVWKNGDPKRLYKNCQKLWVMLRENLHRRFCLKKKWESKRLYKIAKNSNILEKFAHNHAFFLKFHIFFILLFCFVSLLFLYLAQELSFCYCNSITIHNNSFNSQCIRGRAVWESNWWWIWPDRKSCYIFHEANLWRCWLYA